MEHKKRKERVCVVSEIFRYFIVCFTFVRWMSIVDVLSVAAEEGFAAPLIMIWAMAIIYSIHTFATTNLFFSIKHFFTFLIHSIFFNWIRK